MTGPEATRARIEGVLRQSPGLEPGIVGALNRLCQIACDELGLLGATTTLIPSDATHTISAASSEVVCAIEEAQFVVGEGPTRDAFAMRRPVLVVELDRVGRARWPGWAAEAQASGAAAVFALPLQVGAVALGVLTLYFPTRPRPGGTEHETAIVLSEIATALLLGHADGAERADASPQIDPGLGAAIDTHAHVYQAQGMVMVALGVSLTEAMSRIRALAWASGQDVTSLASDIVAGRVRLSRDDH